MEPKVELDPDHLHICQDCCKLDLLKMVAAKPFPSKRCVLCSRRVNRGAHTADLEFVKAVKASILYHHADIEFDHEYGGESLQHFVSGNNQLFETPGQLDASDEECFALSILERFDDVKEVSILFDTFLPAIKFGEHRLLETIESELKVRNYYLVEENYVSSFEALKPHVAISLPKGSVYYRARIGSKPRAVNVHLPSKQRTYFHEPYRERDIGAPPVNTCGAGRLNRPGIAMLYLGSTESSAIAEVRPHRGDAVSIGRFRTTRELSIADFTKHDLLSMYSSDELLDRLRLSVSIDKSLATPAPPSDQRIYSVTQFLGQVFRRMGFDGILFRSTVSDGLNLVVFDPDACVWVEGSSKVVSVQEVHYSYKAMELYDPSCGYDIDLAEMEVRRLKEEIKQAELMQPKEQADIPF